MKRICIVTIIAILSTFTLAEAADVGRFCWNLMPFADNIEVNVETQGTTLHYELYGVLRCPMGAAPNCMLNQFFPTEYSVAIDGSATPDPIHADMDFQFSFSDFDMSLAGTVHAKLLLPGLNGPWQAWMTIPPGAPAAGGQLVPIGCPIP